MLPEKSTLKNLHKRKKIWKIKLLIVATMPTLGKILSGAI